METVSTRYGTDAFIQWWQARLTSQTYISKICPSSIDGPLTAGLIVPGSHGIFFDSTNAS